MDNNYNFNQMIKNTSNITTNNNNDTINDNNTKYNIDNIKGENKLKKLLTNKIFLLVLSILTFVFTLIVVSKTFYLRNIVDHYE